MPVINLGVPPESFFLAAPILITALYVYLHLYLLNLWEALGDAPATIKGAPLAKKAHPTMIATAALWYRQLRRRDGCLPPRPMSFLTTVANTLLVWVFGWAVLGALWWRSMPAHFPWLTLSIGLCLAITLMVGLVNARMVLRSLGRTRKAKRRFAWAINTLGFVLLVSQTAAVSWARTDGTKIEFDRPFHGGAISIPTIDLELTRANLFEKELTIKPADWLDYEQWVQDYEHTYKTRNGLPIGEALTGDHLNDFRKDMKTRRKALIDALQNKSLQGRDLRKAKLFIAFLAGANLREAQMEGADLWRADLRSMDLRDWSIARMSLRLG